MKIFKITYDGTSYYTHDICSGVYEIQGFDIGSEITISVIEMTEQQYNNLPEFNGF